jgi:hypothetical protein
MPLNIGNTHIKLLAKENLFCNYIVLLPIESNTNKKRVSLIEYSVTPDDNYIGYIGGYCFVIKIKKHGNKTLLCRIEKKTIDFLIHFIIIVLKTEPWRPVF